MRALWVKAPFVLLRHPALFLALVFVTALSALAAVSSPLVRAGVESESLQGQLQNMTPLSAGLEITVHDGDVAGDRARRAAAVRLGRSQASVGAPVVSSLLTAQVAGRAGAGVEVVALARTGAVAHVHQKVGSGGTGVWIADSTAKAANLRPGSTLALTERAFFGRVRVAKVRVAGIYRSLEGDRDNPYWANWVQDIRAPDPDSSPPPAFVLMSESTFERVAKTLRTRRVENRFELPVDPKDLTLTRAKRLHRRLSSLAADVERGAAVAQPLGCIPQACTTSSALSSALILAQSEVAAVSPTISLLAISGLLIALGLSFSAGAFLVRRRTDEADALFARGEATFTFATRVAVEALLPGAAGLAVGLGGALLAVRASAPAGTTDGAAVADAGIRGLLACGVAIASVAAAAAAAFPRHARVHPSARRIARLPWEIVPLAAAAALLAAVLSGHGLTRDAAGTTHPRLAIFILPLVAVPGAAGVAVRAGRRLIDGRGAAAPAPLFLALRRLATARRQLVAVVVATAAAFGTFAYASTLSASLSRSTAEKAWVSNGSDVQGLVDAHDTVPGHLPFPVALVQLDSTNVSFTSGTRVDLISGDPAALAATLRWGRGWSDDPRRLLPRLAERGRTALAAIATPGAPDESAIIDQGARLPIRIVGHAPVPGATAGRAALLVSRPALRRMARQAHILDPAPQAEAYVWAKGPPKLVERALARSPLSPMFMTTPAHISSNPSVRAAERSYRFVRVIGIAAAALSMLALILYLQARQRSQLIATAIVRRMGLGRLADAGAVALEAGVIALFAASIGCCVAIAVARPIVRHVDSLPQYAPAPVFTVPWSVLGLGLVAAVCVAASLGAAAAFVASRSDAAGALRVA